MQSYKPILLMTLSLLCTSCGNGSTGTQAAKTPQLTPPLPPTEVRVIAGNSMVELQWAASAGATSYNVYFGVAPGIIVDGSGTIKVPDVIPGKKINISQRTYFALTAVNADGESALSSEVFAAPSTVSFVFSQAAPATAPVIADYDGDGNVEPFGVYNDGLGAMSTWAAGAVSYIPGNAHAGWGGGAVAADFNNDGIVDFLDDAYSNYPSTMFIGSSTPKNVSLVESLNFASLNIHGYCESVVVADFNNDGYSDAFIPCYAYQSLLAIYPDFRSYLLINDGLGNFTEIAISAGVAMIGEIPPEGAQAVDLNGDGWVDLYSAGNLFTNNGNSTFMRVNEAWGLPSYFDEGVEFMDFDNDGRLDIALWQPWNGGVLRLLRNTGSTFEDRTDLVPLLQQREYTWGLTAVDINADGWMDLIIPSDGTVNSELLLNDHGRFFYAQLGVSIPGNGVKGAAAVGDFDRDGLPDIYSMNQIFMNKSTPVSVCGMRLRLTDSAGRLNQHGKVVRVFSANDPTTILTRVVNGGSGYTTQNEYDINISTPGCGLYTVQAQLTPGLNTSVAVDTTTRPFITLSP